MHCLEDGEAVHPQNIFMNNRYEADMRAKLYTWYISSICIHSMSKSCFAHGSISVRGLGHERAFEERIAFISIFFKHNLHIVVV